MFKCYKLLPKKINLSHDRLLHRLVQVGLQGRDERRLVLHQHPVDIQTLVYYRYHVLPISISFKPIHCFQLLLSPLHTLSPAYCKRWKPKNMEKKRYIYVHLCWKHFWPLPLTLYILPFQMILWSSSWFSFPFTVIGLEVAVSDWRHAMWRQSDNNSRDNNYFACTVARPRTCRILMKGQRLNHNHMHASLWLCPLCLFFVK